MFLNDFLKNTNKSPEVSTGASRQILAKAKVSGRLRPGFKLLAVEPRVMFDGAALATAEVALDRPEVNLAPEARSFETPKETSAIAQAKPVENPIEKAAQAPDAATILVPTGPRQLLVVDPGVPDWQALIANVPKDVEVLVLDPTRGGIRQIAERAQSLGQVSALHVLSHGEQARLTLAGEDIDVAALVRSQADLQAIGRAMTAMSP
jgi:large repetitive protein